MHCASYLNRKFHQHSILRTNISGVTMNKSENQIQPALVATIAGTSLALPAMYLLGILEPKGISSAPANSSYFLFLNALCVLVLFLFELKTMNTNNHGIKSSDQGIASAI